MKVLTAILLAAFSGVANASLVSFEFQGSSIYDAELSQNYGGQCILTIDKSLGEIRQFKFDSAPIHAAFEGALKLELVTKKDYFAGLSLHRFNFTTEVSLMDAAHNPTGKTATFEGKNYDLLISPKKNPYENFYFADATPLLLGKYFLILGAPSSITHVDVAEPESIGLFLFGAGIYLLRKRTRQSAST